ncbi:MAG: hypothetical protein PHO90_02055 [Candidatus Pacebacteria bacterium]|nr:hypothetical protein [Candidatus Paceibacterota bacterium]
MIGVNDTIELERQKLTLDKLLDIIIVIDDKLSGKDIKNIDNGLKILIENVVSGGDVTGLDGKTSNKNMKKIFENPLNVEIKNIYAKGSVTGVKLDIDEEIQVKSQVKIITKSGGTETRVKMNPEFGKIILGKSFTKDEPKKQD